MKGLIKAYSEAVNAGIITGEDGRCYPFTKGVWGHKAAPANDAEVVFTVERGRAVQVVRDGHAK